MAMRRMILALLAAATLSIAVAEAQQKPPVVTFPRIYVFEAGSIKGLDPKLFNFKREELKEVDFVNIAYLIVHPKGTIMFDTGGIPDSAFKAGGGPVTEGIMSATKPLKPQLASVGYKPSDIRYLILSHYHSDHTANANDFAGATWSLQCDCRGPGLLDNHTAVMGICDLIATMVVEAAGSAGRKRLAAIEMGHEETGEI